MIKLTIELVPKTCWFSNVRKHISNSEWDLLRKETYRKAKNRCEICDGVGSKHPVECHEIWNYDDETYTQRLEGLIALCPSCHSVKHIGLASLNDHFGEAVAHLAKVNGWSALEAEKFVANELRIWKERSQHEWTLDLSWLEHKGIHPRNKMPHPG
jgi:hypothetical protein